MATAAELTREYKELYDRGIITQAEFNKKKEKFLVNNNDESHVWIECVTKGSELLDDGIIANEDFDKIKANVFSDSSKEYKTDIADIRALRELFISGSISDEDFENLKGRVLKGEKVHTLDNSTTLGMLRTKHNQGIFDDVNYEVLKKKYLNPKTDPYPNLNSNISDLVIIHNLLKEGYITEDEYAVFQKTVAEGKAIKAVSEISPIKQFKEVFEKGFITEDELGVIRKDLLFGKKRNDNYSWPGFFEKVMDFRNREIVSEEEYESLKSAYIKGSKVPDKEAFDKIERYVSLAGEGLFDTDELEILKDRAYSGVEILTDDKLKGIREYKNLLDEGTITKEDFRQYKSAQLVLSTGKKFVIMDASEIKKAEKRKRKKIVKWVFVAVLVAAIVGAASYIPKYMAHKAVDDFISESDSMLAKRQYDEVMDKVDELQEEENSEKLSEQDMERLVMLRKYASRLKSFDFTSGGEGESPHSVFTDMNDQNDLKDYGIMPYLYDSFSKYKDLESLTNENGDITGTETVTTVITKKAADKDSDKTEGEKESEKTETVTSDYPVEGWLTVGFTKTEANAELTENNLIPTAHIKFSAFIDGNEELFDGSVPLEQMGNFTLKQMNGTNEAICSFKNGAINVTIGDDIEILLDTPKSVKKSSSSSSSSSSGRSSSSKSYGSDDSSSEWHENPTGNGYINDEGYIVYDNNGITEITDGKGNWAQDRDGDGNLDTFGSDSWE